VHITYDAFKDYTKFVYETADDSIGGLSVELTCPGCRDQCRPLAVALAYLGFGDNENALLWLDRAVDHQEKGLMIFAVPVASPILDPLRSRLRIAAAWKRRRCSGSTNGTRSDGQRSP
jgi:hypothetical protein